MVSRVGAGLNDSASVSRRTVRRAVGLAVAGSVMVTAGLAAWLLSAVGGVVPQSAAGVIRVAGLGLVVVGALGGLAMILTLLGVGRATRSPDLPPAAGELDDDAGPGTAGPARAASAAPEPLPERVPQPAPEWAHEPGPERAPEPAPEWAREPVAEWVPGPPAALPAADQLAGSPVAGAEVTSDEQLAEPARARSRPARKSNVGWNPDSAEDWLRVLRGLRGSEASPPDQHED